MSLLSQSGLNLQVSVVGSLASAVGIGNANQSLNVQDLLQLLGGTGAGQIDTVFEATATLAASGTVTYDLSAGGLVDPFGAVATFGHVKAVLMISDPSSLADLTFGNATAPAQLGFGAAASTWSVSPGECFYVTKGGGAAVGWVITNTTADSLKITNGAGGASKFQLLILGTSS